MPAFPDPEPEVLQDRADRPVVLVGDRVRHPSQPWSTSVQALLGHLRAVGFTATLRSHAQRRPVVASPCTKNRWKARNKITNGMTETSVIAISAP